VIEGRQLVGTRKEGRPGVLAGGVRSGEYVWRPKGRVPTSRPAPRKAAVCLLGMFLRPKSLSSDPLPAHKTAGQRARVRTDRTR